MEEHLGTGSIPSLLLELKDMRPFRDDGVEAGAGHSGHLLHSDGGAMCGGSKTSGIRGGGLPGDEMGAGAEPSDGMIHGQTTAGDLARQFKSFPPEQRKWVPEESEGSPVSKILSDRLASLRRARRRLEMELEEIDVPQAVIQAPDDWIQSQKCEIEDKGGMDEGAAGSSLDGLVRCLLRETDLADSHAGATRYTRGGHEVGDGSSWLWVQESIQSLNKAMAVLGVTNAGNQSGQAARESRDSVSVRSGSTMVTEKSHPSLEMSNIYAEADDFLSRSSYEMSSLWHGLLSGAHDDILDDDNDDHVDSDLTRSRAGYGIDHEEDYLHGGSGGEMDGGDGGHMDAGLPRSVLGSEARVVYAVLGNVLPPAPTPPPLPTQQTHLAAQNSMLPSLSHTTCSVRSSSSFCVGEGDECKAGELGLLGILDEQEKIAFKGREASFKVDSMPPIDSAGGGLVSLDAGDTRIEALTAAVVAVRRDVSSILSLIRMRDPLAASDSASGAEWEDVQLVGRDLLNHSSHIEALSTSLAIIPPNSHDGACSLEPLVTSIAHVSFDLHTIRSSHVDRGLVKDSNMLGSGFADAMEMQQRVRQELREVDVQIAQIERVKSTLVLQDLSTITLDLIEQESAEERIGQVRAKSASALGGIKLGMSDIIVVAPLDEGDFQGNSRFLDAEEQSEPLSDAEVQIEPIVTPSWVAAVDAACQVSHSLMSPHEEMSYQKGRQGDIDAESSPQQTVSQEMQACANHLHSSETLVASARGRYSDFIDRHKDARGTLVASIERRGVHEAVTGSTPAPDLSLDSINLRSLLAERAELVAEMASLCTLFPSPIANGATSTVQNSAPTRQPTATSNDKCVMSRKFCSSKDRAELAARLTHQLSSGFEGSPPLQPHDITAASRENVDLGRDSNSHSQSNSIDSDARVQVASTTVGGKDSRLEKDFTLSELPVALEKLCQGLADLHFLKEIFVTASARTSATQGLATPSSASWKQDETSPAFVLDLSGMDDEEDLLDRLRKSSKGSQAVSELDLSGCPAGPGSKPQLPRPLLSTP